MKAEDYSERKLELEGWPVNVTTYRVGAKWHAKADNVSPGAALSRAEADSKEAAEARVIERARELLSRTRRHNV